MSNLKGMQEVPIWQFLFGKFDDAKLKQKRAQTIPLLVTYCHTRKDAIAEMLTSDKKDNKLEKRFLGNFETYVKMILSGDKNELKDQKLSDKPGEANALPIKANMMSSPKLISPGYNAVQGNPMDFIMRMNYTDVFQVMGTSYTFKWAAKSVPKDGSKSKTNEGGALQSLGGKMSRAWDYHQEDYDRTSDLVGSLGEVGLGAVTLSAANSILRYVGNGISWAIETIFRPENAHPFVFNEPGLHIVVCSAIPDNEGKAHKRPPSVAYLPVNVRSPQKLASQSVDQSKQSEDRNRTRLEKLKKELEDQKLSKKDRLNKEKEKEALEASLGSVHDQLIYQKKQLQLQLKKLKPSDHKYKLTKKRLADLELMIKHQKERGLANSNAKPEKIHSVFVADAGNKINMLLESVFIAKFAGTESYQLSDTTTKSSGTVKAYGSTKQNAIESGLKELLEGISGYGRGYCSFIVDGKKKTIRIAASAGSLMMEAVDNLAMVASVAVVAAAPFTGGTSLSLMIPIGVVGAIPSGYRLLKKAELGTLDMGLHDWMDIVNIVGGIVGLGQLKAGNVAMKAAVLGQGQKLVRVSGALMILGIGADGMGVALMGAQVIKDLESLQGLPPEMRAAAFTKIMGQVMVQAGIMAGGSMAGRKYQHAMVDAKVKEMMKKYGVDTSDSSIPKAPIDSNSSKTDSADSQSNQSSSLDKKPKPASTPDLNSDTNNPAKKKGNADTAKAPAAPVDNLNGTKIYDSAHKDPPGSASNPLKLAVPLDRSKALSVSGDAGSTHGAAKGRLGAFDAKVHMADGSVKDVVVKVVDSAKHQDVFLREINGAYGASKTGMAEYFGIVQVTRPNGTIDGSVLAFAMGKVQGGFVENFASNKSPGYGKAHSETLAAKKAVSETTVNDIAQFGKRLIDNDYFAKGDLQGLVDANGNWRPIDFSCIRPLTKVDPNASPKVQAEQLAKRTKEIQDHNSTFKRESDGMKKILKNRSNTTGSAPPAPSSSSGKTQKMDFSSHPAFSTKPPGQTPAASGPTTNKPNTVKNGTAKSSGHADSQQNMRPGHDTVYIGPNPLLQGQKSGPSSKTVKNQSVDPSVAKTQEIPVFDPSKSQSSEPKNQSVDPSVAKTQEIPVFDPSKSQSTKPKNQSNSTPSDKTQKVPVFDPDKTQKMPAIKPEPTQSIARPDSDATQIIPRPDLSKTKEMPAIKPEPTQSIARPDLDATQIIPRPDLSKTKEMPAIKPEPTQSIARPDLDATQIIPRPDLSKTK